MAEQPSRVRQAGPLLWLVIAVPVATIIAGITTIVLSVRSGSTDAVIDPVRRTAQVQDREMAADQNAVALALMASGSRDADTGAIQIQLSGNHGASATLGLAVLHPVRGSEDQRIDLVPAGGGRWLGRLEVDAGHDWNLELSPADGSWRLVGRWQANQNGFELRPALGR